MIAADGLRDEARLADASRARNRIIAGWKRRGARAIIRRMQRFRPPLSPDDLAAIAERLRAGGIAIVPTDTVYGVAALPSRADALARIVEAKGRDPRKPCQLLASSAEAAFAATGRPPPPPAEALARAFWPGALTLVARHQPSLTWDLGDARGTVAVRMPLHPVAIELLKEIEDNEFNF